MPGWRRPPRRRRSWRCPASSTPDRIVGHLAHDARRAGTPPPPGARAPPSARRKRGRRRARPSRARARDRPRRPRARARRRPRGAQWASRRRAARGPWRARRSRRGPARRAVRSRCIASPMPLEGTASNRRSARPNWSGSAPRARTLGRAEARPRQVALVLACAGQLLGLLRSAAQQRRPNTGPLEQHGDRGAERPGPDDGGAAWMLAGVADGRRS